MADDFLLTQALEAFDVYVVGELSDGRRLMSRDGRTPVDDTVVFVEDAPDTEMSVVDAEREFGSILWMMEPEVATMTAATPTPTPTPPVDAKRTVNFTDRLNQSDFVILAEARARDAANPQPEMAPAAKQPVVEMPAPAPAPQEEQMMPTEQAAVEMTEQESDGADAMMAEGDVEATDEPAGMSDAAVMEFGQMLSEAEKRVDQLEGLVATMVMDEVRDETFDQMGGTEKVMPEAKVGSVIQIAYEFGDLSQFLGRVAAVGDTEVTPDMEERLKTLVDRLEKLEATITEMMDAEVEDEELEDEEEDEAPESEQTVIDETVPPSDQTGKTAAFFTNARGVRVWHDPTTGKFAPAGFVSPKLLMKLWKGDAAAGVELDSAVRKARSANPGMDMDSVVAKVLGPVPTESMKRAYWEAGRRRVGRMWPATRGRATQKPRGRDRQMFPEEVDVLPSPREIDMVQADNSMTEDQREAVLRRANLLKSDLLIRTVGVDLRGANLNGVNLSGKNFWTAKLSESDLRYADLTDANLSESDLRRANLQDADLSGANLFRADLSGADLSGADLSGATLTGVRYDDTTVWPEGFTPPAQSIDMVQADNSMTEDQREAVLRRANLLRVDLLPTKAGVDLRGADLKFVNLSGKNFWTAKLSGSDLRRANLTDANLNQSDLRYANLTGANLTNAMLRRANLQDADLYSANLSGADLTGADLSGANLRAATLTGVRYDDTTVWPIGFTPPEQSIDMVQAERSDGLVFPNGNPKKIDWPADLPACDICGKPAPFDVPTAGSGRWANLCPDHAPEFGAQTGIGFERVKPGMGDRSPSERMDAATREMLTAAGLTEEDMDLFDGDLIDMDFVQADNPDGSMQSGPTIQVVLPEAAALFYDGPNYGGDATLQAKLDAAPRRRRGRGEAIVVNLTEAELNDLERSFRTESSGRNVDSEFLGSRSRILDQIGDYQNDFERMKSGGVARFQIRPGADLSGKNMSGTMIAARANLTGANLSGANFERATLTKAKLRNANLTGANLNRAMLWQADLRGADLRGADLTGATLDEVIYDDTTVWPEGFTPPEQSIDMVQADNPMAENADTFDLAMNFNRYGREEVAERLGVDPDNVSRPTSLGDLQEMMGDDVSAAEARAFVDRLTERGLMEWINDRDGGLMWADENQYMTELSATDGMAEDLRLSTVSLGTSTALNYLRTRFPNLGRPGWNTTGRPDREVVAELVAEAFSDKGLDVGFLDDAVAEVMRVLAQSG